MTLAERRSIGRKTIEEYYFTKELPKDLYVNMVANTCVFCGGDTPSKIFLLSDPRFKICRICKDHQIDVEAGKNAKGGFKYQDYLIFPYFIIEEDQKGWVYQIEIARVHWVIEFGDEDNTEIFSSRELALVAGIRHLLTLI